MKRTIWTAALAACTLAAAAQEERTPVPLPGQGGRIYRTEVVPYDARNDADARNREAGGYWKAFRPELIIESDGDIAAFYGAKIEIPFAWTDGRVFLHLENTGAPYSLWLNDQPVAEVNDPLTPAEFDLSSFIREGVNNFRVLLRSRRQPRGRSSTAATSIIRTNGRSPTSRSRWFPTRWGATSGCST